MSNQTPAVGAPVQLSDRDAVPADTKSQLFYPHYRGLTGTVAKVYPDGTVAVNVDSASLPESIRTRHEEDTERQRRKWLDGLSDEARNRLSAAEKQFGLRYTVLAAAADVLPLAEGAPARKSLADLEAEEARHLEETAKRRKG